MAIGIHEYGNPEANLPLNQVILGDCVSVMRKWPADSIDLVVTSPPYWGLRDYGTETVRVWGGRPECEHEWNEYEADRVTGGAQRPPQTKWKNGPQYDVSRMEGFCVKCGAWRGSLGLEPHPQMFIDHLVDICREIKRVLKPTATFWLNLGDTYYSSSAGNKPSNVEEWGEKGDGLYKRLSLRHRDGETEHSLTRKSFKFRSNWLQPKQKLMMPARVAIALQHDGWILRSDIIWHKPNHMPSSVKDRLTTAYEHVFLFAKARRYYFDLDSIRQPHTSDGEYRNKLRAGKEKYTGKGAWSIHEFGSTSVFSMGSSIHPKGKNPGDLWRIPTMPFPGAHFATFPPDLIKPIVKAGSPRWICSKCGKPRTRITEPTPEYAKKLGKSVHNHKDDLKRGMRYDKVCNAEYVTTGWSDCGCGEGWDPGVVLDPFGGSGTVGKVARRLGRRFIIIEIKSEYAEMARQRVRGKYKPIPPGVVSLTQIMEAEK